MSQTVVKRIWASYLGLLMPKCQQFWPNETCLQLALCDHFQQQFASFLAGQPDKSTWQNAENLPKPLLKRIAEALKLSFPRGETVGEAAAEFQAAFEKWKLAILWLHATACAVGWDARNLCFLSCIKGHPLSTNWLYSGSSKTNVTLRKYVVLQ